MGTVEKVGKVGKPVERERKGMWGSVAIGVLVGLLVLLLGTFLAVLFCGCAEKYIVQLFGLEEWQKYEALKFLGIGMGGAVLALQAAIANKRAQAMEKTAKAQDDTAKAQVKANKNTEQGQRQERLKNAIEHLGNASGSVRLGGAYELFHLAEDEDEDTAEGKKDLRQTVLDILCAHIRRTTGEPKYRDKYSSNPSEEIPSEEIQSLLNLLFVQEHEVFTGRDINLQGSCLNGSNLNKARLEKADLRGAQLHLASLMEAQLHGADLRGAQLHGAYLWDAQLHGAFIFDAQLHGAHLRGAQLRGANLTSAQLHGANLIGAQLFGADLWDAQLHEADLTRAQLHGASSNEAKPPYEPFETVIKRQICKDSDLSGAISAGGLTPEAVASIGKGLPDEAAKRLREKLAAHIGPPESRAFGLPENSGASIGAYTKEDAAQWIAEYKTALSAVSESG